ncbi:MAG TPA: hypothetical protein VGE89_08470 [Bryobacteraceae bacterium]|jgi:NAD(P)-dependent dehydrogenase (short-subunit alcohol dehydrogenase family)
MNALEVGLTTGATGGLERFVTEAFLAAGARIALFKPEAGFQMAPVQREHGSIIVHQSYAAKLCFSKYMII